MPEVRPRFADHRFWVSEPVPEWDGSLWVVVEGRHTRRHGPFASAERAQARLHDLFQRWRARARQLGGWVWKRTHHEWIVTLPQGVPCQGQPFASAPVSRHH